jgi:hypothetical protein
MLYFLCILALFISGTYAEFTFNCVCNDLTFGKNVDCKFGGHNYVRGESISNMTFDEFLNMPYKCVNDITYTTSNWTCSEVDGVFNIQDSKQLCKRFSETPPDYSFGSIKDKSCWYENRYSNKDMTVCQPLEFGCRCGNIGGCPLQNNTMVDYNTYLVMNGVGFERNIPYCNSSLYWTCIVTNGLSLPPSKFCPQNQFTNPDNPQQPFMNYSMNVPPELLNPVTSDANGLIAKWFYGVIGTLFFILSLSR